MPLSFFHVFRAKTLANQALGPGRHVLQNKKEISPYQLGAEIVLQDIDAVLLFKNAHSAQEAALAECEQGDPVDTDQPSPCSSLPRTSALPQPSTVVAHLPLAMFIAPVCQAFAIKEIPASRYAGLSAKEKAKLKSRDAWQQKRSTQRQEEMDLSGAVLKGYVQWHIECAPVIIISSSCLPIRSNTWTGHQVPPTSVHILSSPDVFWLSVLQLVARWKVSKQAL